METQFELDEMSKSEIILQKCKSLPRPEGLEQLKFRLEEQFYRAKLNRMVMIKETEGDDLQSILAYWVIENQERHKDLIIPYFVEHESQNHYNAMYYILTKLRAIFNITQKVELEGEKLKQYFEYWLNLCSRELGNQLYSDCRVTYKRVIILFKGIDRFKDSNGEVRVSSWLPKVLPENLLVIASAKLSSKAFENINTYITIETETEEIITKIKETNLQQPLSKISEGLKKQPHFLKMFFTILSNKKEEYQQIIQDVLLQCESEKYKYLEWQTESDFFNTLIAQYIEKEHTASSMLSVLSQVSKGVSVEEICTTCNSSSESFYKLYNFFEICILERNQVYSIYVNEMKQAIPQIKKELYEQYLLILEHSHISSRKLEELISQYSRSKRYFKLKEIIINIEHFLILWNPYNKFELCQLWNVLEQNGYDLVMEYNKAVENFQAIYKPSTEGLFFIMLQICIFLREFSNFEKSGTPAYRHPELRGQSIEFEEVGLYAELSQMNMLSKKKPKMNEDYFPQLAQLENLNLDIRSNRDSFIEHYVTQFDSQLLNEFLQTKQDYLKEKLLTSNKSPNPYYYKRWLWVQFPWLALAQKNNFSKLMQFYGKDSTQYMSIAEEMQINNKAIKLVINAKNQKETEKTQKLQIKLRNYSPVPREVRPLVKESRTPSTGRTLPPLTNKSQYIKKLDQLQYQNKKLKNKLNELQTIKSNLQPEESTIEAYKLNENSKQQELRKQTENLQNVQNEMKRMQTVLKLCQFNQDYNEERVQQLFKHCKNLDRVISEYKSIIKDLNEKLQTMKSKVVIQQPKKIVKQLAIVSQKAITSQHTEYKIKVQFDENKPPKRKISIKEMDKMRETQTRLMLEQMPSNRMIGSGYRLSFREDQHQVDQAKQIALLGMSNSENLDNFLSQMAKFNELTLEAQECTVKLHQVKIKKHEQQTFLRILQKNEKPQEHYEQIGEEDTEKLKRQNDNKTIQLKKLKQHRAVYHFFHQNLWKDVNAFVKVRSEATLTELINNVIMIRKGA